ncbi:ExbD/TolR family protein [Cellvibrio japonicus]|uniref:ExbD n=1 Tax=Cellvibrio japonicus (strain Ueda107) TaxID=498211 RepID=B3PCI2_CELJU|nr:biopolymer transporter ExbD [Cellvibrio japonicus]ACE84757.1 ExbD [Cellvibrio japonicus Ueda107]QEI11885.1 biopolymer transporter ExbD [Cellvibrio japonicus]QEI15459.1 biopolymer transporter ExbD [Cellvibrio japonicus]QEI19038.1 biopolymer transporter ExbD [Cellvibrio japonicus]
MAFGGGLDDDSEVMSEINMTPLVDVMLVLLIIFIITVPVLTHSVKVDLPRADNTPNEIKPETINIAVSADGTVFWNDTPVSLEELEARLGAAAALQPQPEVHIRGDKAVSYEHVVTTMAAVQRAGILKLGFVTEPGS